MTMWRWLRHALGLDITSRVDALERRQAANKDAVKGAMNAFDQLVKDSRR